MSRNALGRFLTRPLGKNVCGVAVVLTDLCAGGLAHACGLMTSTAACAAGAVSLAGILLTARGLADALLPPE